MKLITIIDNIIKPGNTLSSTHIISFTTNYSTVRQTYYSFLFFF